MSNFALNIQFTNTDLVRVLEEGRRVTIIKQVQGATGAQTIWTTFSPFQSNTVAWENEYGVYASNTEVEEGATIDILSTVNPAISATRYPFSDDKFGFPQGYIPQDSYGIANEGGQKLTFGLVQTVAANSETFASPLNAIPILEFQMADFRPVDIVQVYLSKDLDNGVVVSSDPSNALTVDFTGNPSQVIRYDGEYDRFLPGPLL